MDPYDAIELTESIKSIENNLDVSLTDDELSSYLNASINYHLAAYEKVVVSENKLPAIKRYLLVAHSYLHQPNVDKFFDIFRAARVLPLIAMLGANLQRVDGIEASDQRLRKLKESKTLDEFDSTLFEILTAARYSLLPNVSSLKFLDEKSKTVPDLEMRWCNEKYFIECKKFNRFTDYSSEVRDDVLARARPIIEHFQQRDESVVVEIVFKIEPEKINEEELRSKVQLFYPTSNTYENDKYSVSISPLQRYRSKNLVLNPSPQLYNRYGYDIRGPWMGIVPFMRAQIKGQNFIDDIFWDVAVKWRIDSPEILWKYKRLAYSTIFKGIDQLMLQSGNSILHVCYERDNPLGARRDELMHFFDTLVNRGDKSFNWLIFNELVFTVDDQGKFEFTEHAHRVSGPKGKRSEPPVGLIFVDDEHRVQGIGEFGIGL